MSTSADAPRGAAQAARPARVTLSGVAIDPLTEAQAVQQVMAALDAGRGGWVITPNVDHLRRARRDDTFLQMLAESDLVVADGMPLIWASRLQGTPLPERVAGSSMVWSIAAAAAQAKRSIYLFGGDPGAAEGAAAVLTSRYPELRIAGTACPPVGFENDPIQMARLREQLRAARPDIVYVALGSPKQERVIRQMRDDLPQTWWLGVGISLSFICGQVRRAPSWMQKAGLEWLHRLMQEPRRLARRYLVEGIPFVAGMLCRAVFARRRSASADEGRS